MKPKRRDQLVGDEVNAEQSNQLTGWQRSERRAEVSAKQSDQLVGDEVHEPNGPTSWSVAKSDRQVVQPPGR
jgi:hypothetical protein